MNNFQFSINNRTLFAVSHLLCTRHVRFNTQLRSNTFCNNLKRTVMNNLLFFFFCNPRNPFLSVCIRILLESISLVSVLAFPTNPFEKTYFTRVRFRRPRAATAETTGGLRKTSHHVTELCGSPGSPAPGAGGRSGDGTSVRTSP